jgi:HD-like signal output (HDOD) protein
MSNTEAMQRALTDVVSRGDFTVPPYPAVALRLQRLLARESYGVGEVADVIAADAALAATVLAAANSALLGAAVPITSLSRAVNRLGARTVGSIAIASGVSSVAVATGVLLDVKFRVWRRGMTCALTCQKLGHARGLVPEDAFLAGLLHGFGRTIAIASLEQLLKTHQPPRPLSVAEWLTIAEQQRAALAHAVAQSWQLPPAIAEAVGSQPSGASALNDLVAYADDVAGELDAGRMPEARSSADARLLDELVAGLPAALEAFAPPAPAPTMRPSPPNPLLAKSERALEGELRKKALAVIDRRAKAPYTLTCLSLAPAGIEVDSNKPFQEGSVVRLAVGEPDAHFEPWFTVALCVQQASRYRVELQLFSPTREARDRWRALYDAP